MKRTKRTAILRKTVRSIDLRRRSAGMVGRRSGGGPGDEEEEEEIAAGRRNRPGYQGRRHAWDMTMPATPHEGRRRRYSQRWRSVQPTETLRPATKEKSADLGGACGAEAHPDRRGDGDQGEGEDPGSSMKRGQWSVVSGLITVAGQAHQYIGNTLVQNIEHR